MSFPWEEKDEAPAKMDWSMIAGLAFVALFATALIGKWSVFLVVFLCLVGFFTILTLVPQIPARYSPSRIGIMIGNAWDWLLEKMGR